MAMHTELLLQPGRSSLVVGDPRRPSIGRAIVWSVALGVVFTIVAWVTKEVPTIVRDAPWAEDPYDAFVSFALFFVPLVTVLAAARLPLCRRDQPLPGERVAGLVRAARLIVILIAATLAAEWVSVVAGPGRASWTTTMTILIATLAGFTALTAGIALMVWRIPGADGVAASAARRDGSPPIVVAARPDPSSADWLADLRLVADLVASRLGPAATTLHRVIGSVDATIGAAVRRHPLGAAAVTSIAFGVALALAAAREEGPGPVMGLFLGVGSAGMFAFLAIAGSYLRVVARTKPLTTWTHRLADSAAAGCLAVPLALAFRDGAWGLIGVDAVTAGIADLSGLVVASGIATFVAVLSIETALRTHRV